MRCAECPIMKQTENGYSCEARCRDTVDMFTEEPNCTAIDWYPKYLTDRYISVSEGINQLDNVMPDLYEFLQTLKYCKGYGKAVVDQLENVYNKFSGRYKLMAKELLDIKQELRRINKEIK